MFNVKHQKIQKSTKKKVKRKALHCSKIASHLLTR